MVAQMVLVDPVAIAKFYVENGCGIAPTAKQFRLKLSTTYRILKTFGVLRTRAQYDKLSNQTIGARFWEYVKKGADCWLWCGPKDKDGYGYFSIFVTPPIRRAHRAAWYLANGKIPDGKFICHKCDTPACVRPSHLFIGTHLENERDKKQKLRHAFGERGGLAKLNWSKVRKMRDLHKKGRSQTSLSVMFNVTLANVGYVVKNKTWTTGQVASLAQLKGNKPLGSFSKPAPPQDP